MSAEQQVLLKHTPEHLHDVSWCKSAPHAAFVFEALSSADENGHLAVPTNLAGISVYMGMLICGWIDRRDGLKGGPYMITDSGHALLKARTP